jgi:hypothetical protein
MGLIDYHGRIRVHKSLLNVVLHDQFAGHNSERPAITDVQGSESKPARHGQST